MAEVVKNPPATEAEPELWVQPLGQSRRSAQERNGNPLQYSCLENSMDRGAWWAIVHGVTKSQARLSMLTRTLSKRRWKQLRRILSAEEPKTSSHTEEHQKNHSLDTVRKETSSEN